MTRWALLTEINDDEYADTGDSVAAATWQEAVTYLLAVQLCRIGSTKARMRKVMRLLDTGDSDTPLRVDDGRYKVVPVADNAGLDEIALRVGIDADGLIDRLRGEGLVP